MILGTIAEKLLYLAETKELIRQAIIDKGVGVETSDPFRVYPDKIKEIKSGGSDWIPFPPAKDLFKEATDLAPLPVWRESIFADSFTEIESTIEEIPYERAT